MYTCYCIGNPLVDYITEVPERALDELELTKGHFHLATQEEATDVLERVKGNQFKVIPGGASANTACGVVRMGGSAVFCGGIGNDDFGSIFKRSLEETGVVASLETYDLPTGFVAVLVTPDAERTFVVYLGASLALGETALNTNMIKNSTFLYFTGYQFESEGLRDVITHAASYCRKTLTRVVMDLGDPGIVERNCDEIQEFVQSYVDIVIANEEEGFNYTGKNDEECVNAMLSDAEYTVLTLGGRGALIGHRKKVAAIPAVKTEPVDTTGAGDMFSAGLLVGLDRGYSHEYVGKMASYAASLVISQSGARINRNIKNEIEEL